MLLIFFLGGGKWFCSMPVSTLLLVLMQCGFVEPFFRIQEKNKRIKFIYGMYCVYVCIWGYRHSLILCFHMRELDQSVRTMELRVWLKIKLPTGQVREGMIGTSQGDTASLKFISHHTLFCLTLTLNFHLEIIINAPTHRPNHSQLFPFYIICNLSLCFNSFG